MKTITRDLGIIYDFNAQHTPIAYVESGDKVEIETYDCFQNQVKDETTEISGINWEKINPATGPIFVKGAMPGDILKVKIEKIDLDKQGVMVVGPGLGVLGDSFSEMEKKLLPITDEHVLFDNIKIPLNKMIGVIGVAPAGEGINCGTPGQHGGNMDNKMMTEGATLYFPVFVEGALFGLGDMHAAMGDGEISVSGIEVSGKATVTLEVIKGLKLEHPMLENENEFTQIVSAETLDEAAKLATKLMTKRIAEKSSLTLAEVTMLMSAVGQVQVCQIVDPLMTARFSVPKWLLEKLNVTLI